MPVYRYQAIDVGQTRSSGIVEAATAEEAKSKLRAQGLMLTNFSEGTTQRSNKGLRGDLLVTFTKQLAQLLKAGLPLYEALRTLEEQVRGEKQHSVVLGLADHIKSGSSLSQAMGMYPDSFDSMYCSMVAAGEAAGALDKVLHRLGDYLQSQSAIKSQITTALIYPIVLASFALLIVIVLLTYVVPSIEQIFDGREVNSITRFVLGVSYVFRTYWALYLPLAAAVIAGCFFYLRSPQGKRHLEWLSMRLPVIRGLVLQAAISRFARTMATLQEGGLTLVEALHLGKGVLKNFALEDVIEEAEARVMEGASLSQRLQASPLIPSMVSRMLAVGEDAGNTQEMWHQIADIYEAELSKTLSRVMALVQPVILLVMGLIIGTVMVAILLPLTDVSSFASE